MTSLALMINTTLCYSATSGSSVADYDKLRRVDMGNVGLNGTRGFTQGANVDRTPISGSRLNASFESSWVDSYLTNASPG